jgi:hypothetical protein
VNLQSGAGLGDGCGDGDELSAKLTPADKQIATRRRATVTTGALSFIVEK